MAQPQPEPIPSSYPLTLIPGAPPHLRALRARRRLLVCGSAAILSSALLAVGYLCCLVRIMQIDTACRTTLEECRKKEAEIGGLTIRLSAVTDARAIELFAAERGLVSPQEVDPIEVSPELCRGRLPQSAAASSQQLIAANTWPGTAGFPGP
jgi:hypothetical protein